MTLGVSLGYCLSFGFQILEIVMLEENPFSTRMTHPLDHGNVIHCVREKDTAGELGTESREGIVVGYVVRRKDKCCGFSMKICKFLFEKTVTGYIRLPPAP